MQNSIFEELITIFWFEFAVLDVASISINSIEKQIIKSNITDMKVLGNHNKIIHDFNLHYSNELNWF